MRILSNHFDISRETELNEMNRKLFGRRTPTETQLEKLPYRLVTLRYLTISRTSGPIIYCRDAYDFKERFGPIQLPKYLWGLARRDDTFLTCIVREEDRWEIRYLSELIYQLP